MTRFDVNCLLGPWPTGGPTLADAAQMRAAMARLGIERALVRHTAGIYYDATDGNKALMAALGAEDRERLLPCWTALPPLTGELGPLEGWLQALGEAQVRAVALYPAAHGYPLADWQLNALLEPLAARRMIVLLEIAQITWDGVHWLCGRYPDLRVVLLESGYRLLRPLLGLLQVHENLYLDISTMSNFYGIETLCAHIGPGRLLFGTGQPRTDGAGVVSALNYAELGAEEKRAIAWDNLERLLGEVRL
ncbi:MAG: amidohydrolase family protein [Chloroflexi bacterium]|nr:amidohydrolase family protein [Chloroflexota bacterium]